MTREEYLVLFEKYIAGQATPEEVDMIMSQADKFHLTNIHPEEDKEHYQAIEDRILNRLNDEIAPRKVSLWHRINWRIAAAVTLFAVAGTILLTYKKANQPNLSVENQVALDKVVKPGSNKALLTLANGKSIVLNDGTSATILKQGNLTVKKQKDGLLQYQITASVPANKAQVEYNTITTPIGGQYQVVLPDGTKVWLNAASSLHFPTAFTGGERRVELTGEGYFEVAKNKHLPFKVAFNDQEVQVLGTHFNIMAYPNEEASQTTLLEGSVSITKRNISRLLVPGQQAKSTIGSAGFDIKQVDTQEAVAWKNGEFLFKNTNIQSIMRQLARWYDVDVAYQGNLQNMVFGGRMSKSKNISEVLKNLELTGTIHFKIEGRRVTVME